MMGKSCGCTASKIVWILVLVGALNWGLLGLGWFFDGNWNVVKIIFGSWDWLENIIYIVVGVAGVSLLFGGCKCGKCKSCKGGDKSAM